MRIVIVAPSDKSYISGFLPNEDYEALPNGYNGAIFIGTLIKEFLNRGHIVTAITTTVAKSNDYEIKSYKEGNFTWVLVPSRPNSLKMNGKKLGRVVDLFSYEANMLAKAIKIAKPDIVHAHWSYEFASAAIKSGYPHLITVHDNAYQVFRYNKTIYRFGRLIMSEINLTKAKCISTVSPYMLPYIKKRNKKVEIIPNPVRINLNEEAVSVLIQTRLKTITEPKIVMINNGWDPRKNGKLGLMAFSLLLKEIPKAQLHLFGSGSEPKGLANKDANAIGLKNIHYRGLIGNKELLEELKSSHLFLHPALEESFGVVLIEAMSLGVPAIGGEISGAVPWVVENEKLLVNTLDAIEMKDKLKELLLDKKKYSITSLECFKNVLTRFSSIEVANNYLRYYKNILEIK
jgi:glycosyltransferase involved in cell wall biosynthesis